MVFSFAFYVLWTVPNQFSRRRARPGVWAYFEHRQEKQLCSYLLAHLKSAHLSKPADLHPWSASLTSSSESAMSQAKGTISSWIATSASPLSCLYSSGQSERLTDLLRDHRIYAPAFRRWHYWTRNFLEIHRMYMTVLMHHVVRAYPHYNKNREQVTFPCKLSWKRRESEKVA